MTKKKTTAVKAKKDGVEYDAWHFVDPHTKAHQLPTWLAPRAEFGLNPVDGSHHITVDVGPDPLAHMVAAHIGDWILGNGTVPVAVVSDVEINDYAFADPSTPPAPATKASEPKVDPKAAPVSCIGWAVKQLHNGSRVRRAGWNGKGMFLILVPGSTFQVTADRPMGIAAPDLVGTSLEYQPHVDMKTAQGSVVPWLASQSDLLATDWEIAN